MRELGIGMPELGTRNARISSFIISYHIILHFSFCILHSLSAQFIIHNFPRGVALRE